MIGDIPIDGAQQFNAKQNEPLETNDNLPGVQIPDEKTDKIPGVDTDPKPMLAYAA